MSDLSKTIAALTPEQRAVLERHLAAKRVAAGEDVIPRRPEGGAAPLSFAQERFWVLDQLSPGSPVYNLASPVRCRGSLRVALLEAALAAVRERHEVLRTTFSKKVQGPVPVVDSATAMPLPVVDLTGLGEDDGRRLARRLSRAEAARPFDLENGPLLRATLLRRGDEDHRLLVTQHHIVSDGWSMGVFLRDLATAYRAGLEGVEASYPEREVDFADYAHWQRRRMRGEALEAKLARARQRLAGAPPVLELPTDRPRPAVQTWNGATRPTRLPAERVAALAALSDDPSTTRFMAVSAAFTALLWRYTHQRDLVFGTPVANRERPEVENLIGPFVNTVVLRHGLDPASGFRVLLDGVRASTLAALADQDLPFALLVDALGTERSLSHGALVQVFLSLQNTPLPAFRLGDLELEPLEVDGQVARFDLSLGLVEGADEDGWSGQWEYNVDLFDEATLARLDGHLHNLLQAVVEDPDSPLAALPLLSAAEQDELIRGRNDSALQEIGPPLLDARILESADRQPEAVALVDSRQQLTYGALARQARRLAARLAPHVAAGRLRHSDRDPLVAVLLPRGADLPVALLGVLASGAAYLPLDPAYPADRLRFMVEDAGPVALITDPSVAVAAELPDLPRLLLPEVMGETTSGSPNEASTTVLRRDPAGLAYAIYTSGSTGRPKAVMVPHASAANFFAAMDRLLTADSPSRAQPTWLAVTSVSFDISVLELLWTLSRGMRVVVRQATEASAEIAPATRSVEVSERPLDFSLFYFASDDGANVEGSTAGPEKYRLLLEGAKAADRQGFAAVWTPERHFHAFGGLFPNPAVVGAAVAAVTEQVEIRAGSVVLPLQSPLRVAEEWAVVDNLSGGRVALSFASGWHADDFVLAPERYAERHRILYEDIDTVRRLWRGETVERVGGAGEPVAVRTFPRPVRPELPFWVTAAGSPATFQKAGEIGARLLTHLLGQDVDELAEKIAVYRRAWEEAGHGAGGGHVTLMVHTFIGEEEEAVKATVREPFIAYLSSSLGLLANLARSLGMDVHGGELSDRDRRLLLDTAFERYYDRHALFGTPLTCLETLEGFKAAGVDEVAALIDFGVDTDAALEGLTPLARLSRFTNRREALPGNRPPGGATEPATISAALARHRVDHLQCTPSFARLLTAEEEALTALSGLSSLLVGGEAVGEELAASLAASLGGPLRNMYGPTETTIWSTSRPLDGAAVTLGAPLANNQVYLFAPDGSLTPPGVPGQIALGGHGVVRGYLGRPALTAERFRPDPFAAEGSAGREGARLYLTGDLGRYANGGGLEFLGRVDHQVKLRGHRIELGEIDARLEEHPGVEQAVTVLREDTPGDPSLVSYFVPRSAHAPALASPLDEAGRAEVLGERRLFAWPNGMEVVPSSDLQANLLYREIFEDQTYLRHGLHLPPGACVLDAGANVGSFTLYAALVEPSARIYSFEPIPPTHDALATNIALYGLNAKALPFGLSRRAEEVEFTFYPEMAGLSGRYAELADDRGMTRGIILDELQRSGVELPPDELESWLERQFRSETHRCELRSLSQVIADEGLERIDFLKVDVERAEVDVLRGIEDGDWPKIRQIALEVDTAANLETVTKILQERGFEVLSEDFVVVEARDDAPAVEVYMVYASREGLQPEAGGPPLEVPAGDAAEVTPEELRRHLAERLPDYMLPAAWVSLEALPLTANGKLDRRALPAPAARESRASAPYVDPGNETERRLAEIWAEALGVERVGAQDNFFELGGNSLLIVQVHGQIREALGAELTLVDLFRHPTIRSLARALTEAPSKSERIDAAKARAEKQRDARRRQARRRAPRRTR